VAGHITSADYVSAKADAYFAWYPEGCRQPSCRRLWVAGQMVLRDYYDKYGGDAAPATPADAHPVNELGAGYLAESTPGVYVQS
jgi:hypothetical protein